MRGPLRRGARVGLLGGSFNPAHGGHRRISLLALDRLALDEVWWLVSPQNPLKDRAGMAPLPARLARAREVARHPRIRVTALEAELGTTRTLDTLRGVQRRYPQARFIWLMGGDNLADFHRWWRWRDIASAAPIAVIARPHYIGRSLSGPAMAWLRRRVHPARDAAGWTDWPLPALVLLQGRLDRRSATELRAADPRWAERHPTIGDDRLG